MKYGTEYRTVLTVGNIKFVMQNENTSVKSPMETMTKGRVYVTVNNQNQLSHITYYDKKLRKSVEVDLRHFDKGRKPHAHLGYEHAKKGTRGLLPKEKRMVDRVNRIWENSKGR